MASELSSNNLIFGRYASALYDLSSEAKCVDEVLSDLLIIQEYINNNKDFKLLIRTPLIASSDKLIILDKILVDHSANALTSTFVKVIANNKRFRYLYSIIQKYITINVERRGSIIADVTSADQLSDKQKSEIKEQLSSVLGGKLSLNFKVNKKIIGGLIVKIGSKMIDSSLASKINKLKIAMKGV